MKELLEGRRAGFAIRPLVGGIAFGLALAIVLLDLMSWAGWGARETNALVVGAQWLSVLNAVVCAIGLATAFAETRDVEPDDFTLARTDAIAVGAALVLYLGSAAMRAFDPGAAAASPPAFLMGVAALVVLGAAGAISAMLYAAREWEEIEEIAPHHTRRRRAASR